MSPCPAFLFQGVRVECVSHVQAAQDDFLGPVDAAVAAAARVVRLGLDSLFLGAATTRQDGLGFRSELVQLAVESEDLLQRVRVEPLAVVVEALALRNGARASAPAAVGVLALVADPVAAAVVGQEQPLEVRVDRHHGHELRALVLAALVVAAIEVVPGTLAAGW